MVDGIIAQVDALFRNSEAEVGGGDREGLHRELHELRFQGCMRVILIVGFLVVGAVVLIAANTSAMGIRERIPEIAILKSLGFRRRPILAALLAESTLQGLARRAARRRRGAYGVLEALRLAGQDRRHAGILGPLGGFRMSPASRRRGRRHRAGRRHRRRHRAGLERRAHQRHRGAAAALLSPAWPSP